MDLFKAVYPQGSLTAEMQALGIPLDGTMAMPWAGDQIAMTDQTGNIIGFAQENVMGGTTFTDENMNTIGTTMSNPMGGETILNSSSQVEGMTMENVHGGESLYGADMQLETISFAGVNGETTYTNDMELLGFSQPNVNGIQHSGFQEAGNPIADVPSYTSLEDFVSAGSYGISDFSSEFVSVDFGFGLEGEALGIFDLF